MSDPKTKPPNFNATELMIVEWLLQPPYRSRYVIETGSYKLSRHFGRDEPIDGSELVKIRLDASIEEFSSPDDFRDNQYSFGCLFENNFLNQLSPEAFAKFSTDEERHGTVKKYRLFIPNRLCLKFWEEHGRSALEDLKRRRLEKEAKVGRSVVLKIDHVISPQDKSLDWEIRSLLKVDKKVPRAFAVADVYKETPERLYIRGVKYLPPYDKIFTRSSFISGSPISGRGNSQFVSRDAILVERPDARTIEQLLELDGDRLDRVQRDVDRTYVALRNLALEIQSSLAQANAEYDDHLMEIKERLASQSTEADGPKF